MNKLKTTQNGGFPFVLDDLKWMDDSYREGIAGILSAFELNPNDTIILSGCVKTSSGTTVTVTEGFLFLNREILYFPGGNLTLNHPASVYFDLDVAYDSSGNKLFEDATTNQTYEVRRAKLVTGPPIAYPKTIYEVMSSKLVKTDLWNTNDSNVLASSVALSDLYNVLEKVKLNTMVNVTQYAGNNGGNMLIQNFTHSGELSSGTSYYSPATLQLRIEHNLGKKLYDVFGFISTEAYPNNPGNIWNPVTILNKNENYIDVQIVGTQNTATINNRISMCIIDYDLKEV